MDQDSSKATRTTSREGSWLTESPGRGRLVLDIELLDRIAAGESVRSVARERDVAHSTLSRRLRRPEGAAGLRAAKQRLRLERKKRSAERAKERQIEKELPRRAREQAARDRELDAQPWTPGWKDRVSQNDVLAAETVAAGGGIHELIEATGLRTRLNVYELVDPQIVERARKNDRSRPRKQPDAGMSRRFIPQPELISRRAAGEPLRRLAKDAGVSPATLSRTFARPEVAKELRLQERELKTQQRNEADPDGRNHRPDAILADHYVSKISDIWCPIHRRRTYVTNVATSEADTRLEVAGCCEEAIQELVRWLKIHRAVLPTGTVFTPAGNAPANATVPPA
jgi:lambda repressor-like predicted transcriptional regulator